HFVLCGIICCCFSEIQRNFNVLFDPMAMCCSTPYNPFIFILLFIIILLFISVIDSIIISIRFFGFSENPWVYLG
ncbi:MAG: hypothetical protein RO469_15265, partial [Thermincola sp.]|nr:hypothetical protein [Thermincola sp.]MDT3702679.1 hypothetical protein [Thermincola sp.]